MTSGAINIENKVNFLHSLCSFDSCYRSGNGGAIYYKTNSPIVQDRFCTTNTTSDWGFHCYTNLQSNTTNKNIIVESCITNCVYEQHSCLIYLGFGQCGLFSSNISRNSVKYHSGFLIRDVNDFCTVNYSTFISNTAFLGCMVHGPTKYGRYKDFLCNAINNTITSDKSGCVVTYAEVTVENCTVVGEYGKGKPFSTTSYDLSTGNLIITNCFVESFDVYQEYEGKYSTSGVIKRPKLCLLSFQSQNCEVVAYITLMTEKAETFIINHHFCPIYILPFNLFFPW